MISLLKVLLVSSLELTHGQNLLSQEVAAFGFWTLSNYDSGSLQQNQFLSYLNKFGDQDLKNDVDFKSEFQYLLNNTDLRNFEHHKEASYYSALEAVWGERGEVLASDLGVELGDLLAGVDLKESVLGFDLFRKVFLERDF